MTREEAREYFNSRLTYKDIYAEELEDLQSRLARRIKELVSDERVDRIRRKDKRFVRQRLLHAYLYISSDRYTRRDLIQFNKGGYIMFYGCSDEFTAKCLLPVFIEWVDSVYKYK